MSSFSRSKNKGHYPDQNHGSEHYKKPHSGGILGKLFNALTGSKSNSRSDSNHNGSRHSNRRQRRSSWS